MEAWRELERHENLDTERFEAIAARLDRLDAKLDAVVTTVASYKSFFAGIVFICVTLAGAVGLAVGVLK